jgi:uncharacterized protein YggU (UPF0235/DUF167 family)
MHPDTPSIHHDGATGMVRFRGRARPRASRDGVAGWTAGVVRARLTAPPVGGVANEALVRFLAGRVRVARSAVRIASRRHGRLEAVEVRRITLADVASARGA